MTEGVIVRPNRKFCSLVVPPVLAIIVMAASAPSGDVLLAAGNPPLTESMVNRLVHVWEYSLDISLTSKQRSEIQAVLIDAWRKNDAATQKSALEDLALDGNQVRLQTIRDFSQSAAIAVLREDHDDLFVPLLVAAYDAAHPDKRRVIQKMLVSFSGTWLRSDALPGHASPLTHGFEGAMSDALRLEIMSTGRFRHVWQHHHCGTATCCQDYGTLTEGTLAFDGTSVIFKSESEREHLEDPCRSQRIVNSIPAHEERVRWWMEPNPRNGRPVLCLAHQPFWAGNPGTTICYEKDPR